MTKPEKLTFVLEQPVADGLVEWAQEEDRPVSNLLRRIVSRAVAEWQRQAGGARAA